MVVYAPVASADGPLSCDQQPPDQQQQCQQQKKGPGVPDIPNNNNANPQQQQQDVSKKPISQVGATYILNGAPICLHNWDVGIPGAVPVVPFQAC
jgi:hypothetical protein